MGEVFQAHDRVLDRTVALKVLHAGLGSDPDFIERFRKEATAAGRLSHPNIVQVYDWDAARTGPHTWRWSSSKARTSARCSRPAGACVRRSPPGSPGRYARRS